MSGFVALQRDALEHPVIGQPDRFYAWFWLVAHACWKPTKTRIKGQVIQLERGQLSFSVRYLAEAWGWSKSRVSRFVAELRDEGMIETCSKNGTTAGHPAGQGQAVLTICNYDKYQDPLKPSRDKVDAPDGTTAGQQRDKEEQGNNSKSYKRAIPANWWPEPFGPNSKCARIIAGWSQDQFETQVEQFIAFHQSKGNKFSDPQAAWQTWAINSEKFKKPERAAQPQRGSSMADLAAQARANFHGN